MRQLTLRHRYNTACVSNLPSSAIKRSRLFTHRRSLAPPMAESLHLQHDESYVVILRPPVRPAIARSDEVFDDLARVAGSGFGQRLDRPGIIEHLAVLIEAFWKAVTHQDQHIAMTQGVFPLTI